MNPRITLTARSRPRARLCLEVLEDRAVPAQYLHWTGPAGGGWGDPSHWLEGRTPAADDILHFGSNWLGSNDNLSVVDADYTVAGIDCGPAAGIDLVGAHLVVTGGLTVGGTLRVTGNLFDPVPALQVGGGILVEAGGTLVTGGNPTALTAGSLLLNTGSTWNVAGGWVDFTGDFIQAGTLNVNFGDYSRLTVRGLYHMFPAGVTNLLTGTLVHDSDSTLGASGTINVSYGWLESTAGVWLNGFLNADQLQIRGDLLNFGRVSLTDQDSLLEVMGDYRQANGYLNMILPTDAYNPTGLTVHGEARLDGFAYLNVTSDGPPLPGSYELIRAAVRTGEFTKVNPPPEPGAPWEYGWVARPYGGESFYLTSSVLIPPPDPMMGGGDGGMADADMIDMGVVDEYDMPPPETWDDGYMMPPAEDGMTETYEEPLAESDEPDGLYWEPITEDEPLDYSDMMLWMDVV